MPSPVAPAGPTWPEARVLVDALSPELLTLMDELSATMFCAKDVTGRYVVVNRVFVARTNERSRRGVVGRRARELFVPELAERYERQDATVLRTGRPLRNELELIRPPGGVPGWYLTSKIAVRAGGDGIPVGLVSISEDLRTHDTHAPAMASLAQVVAYVDDHLDGPIAVEGLAAAGGSSVSALERRMRRVFALSPTQFVMRARIDRAADLLANTDMPLAEIGQRCGFYDQPSFSRTFARLAGETPSGFRRRSASGRPARRQGAGT